MPNTPPLPDSPSPPRTPLRRRVRRAGTDGTRAQFVTKSFSRDDGTLYRPTIDTATGAFFCDCPDHRYRGSFCKHLRRAAAQLNAETGTRKRKVLKMWKVKVPNRALLHPQHPLFRVPVSDFRVQQPPNNRTT